MATKEDNSAVTFDTLALGREIEPRLFHSSFTLHNYYFTDRLDLFAVGDPGKRALFIDVGLDDLCGTDALDTVIKQLEIPYSNAEVFITHFHDDHDGNLPYCVEKGVRTVYHGPYIPYSNERLERFMQVTGINKAGDHALRDTTEFLMGKDRIPPQVQECLVEVEEGDIFTVGDFALEVLFTPGHALEHISLLDRTRKILFAGDHLLDSPAGLLQLDPDAHLVSHYLKSLDQIKELGLEVAYLSHTDPLLGADAIADFVDRAKAKYDRPLGRIKTIVEKKSGATVYEIAEEYYSYLKGGGLQGQPDKLRMRRIAIMLSFLDYLCGEGVISNMVSSDGMLLYHAAR